MKSSCEVVRLTEVAVNKLLLSREAARPSAGPKGKRRASRWPFPGVVELWMPDEHGDLQHSLATSVNLSSHGIGIRCDEPLEPSVELEIAFHEPEMSFHGRATVRHATKIETDYLVGLEFKFE